MNINNQNVNTNSISGNPNSNNWNGNETNIRNKNKVKNFNSSGKVNNNPNNSLRKNNKKELIKTHELEEREKMLEMYVLFSIARKGIMSGDPTNRNMTLLANKVRNALRPVVERPKTARKRVTNSTMPEEGRYKPMVTAF